MKRSSILEVIKSITPTPLYEGIRRLLTSPNASLRRREELKHYRRLLERAARADAGTEREEVMRKLTEEAGLEALPAGYLELLRRTVTAYFEEDPAYEELREEFTERTGSLDKNLLTGPSWLTLYHLALARGLASAGFRLRSLAVDRCLDEARNAEEGGGKKGPKLEMGFRAAVDRGRFRAAETFLERIRGSREIPDEMKRRYEAHLHLTRGDAGRARELWWKGRPPEEEFRRYLEDRSVAVVGPAASGGPQGEEIDRFDRVARLNFYGPANQADPVMYGRRADLSYYSATDIDKIRSMDDRSFFDELDYVIFKLIRHDYQREMMDAGRARAALHSNLLLSGSPLMGPIIMEDLLHFTPSRIKIFYMDFYHHPDYYHKQYAKEHNPTYRGLFSSLAGHDCLSQLHFVRNLWKGGLLEGDEAFERVMQMDSERYMASLEKSYPLV